MPDTFVPWTRAYWQERTCILLSQIGPGLITPSAYDTAWVARLMGQDHDLGAAALEWLSANQLSDGSWGTLAPVCYHDRIICTLSAMTTLARYGRRANDQKMIKAGQAALEELTHSATNRLVANPAGATVGFEMIAPTLVTEAEELGLLASQGGRIMGRLEKQRKLKMSRLAGMQIDRTLTAAFSLEMVGENLSVLDLDNLSDTNGSVAYSPSATAFYLSKIHPGNAAALEYLKRLQCDGAVPYVGPADVFECAWSMWNFLLNDWGDSLADRCKQALAALQAAWNPEHGCGAATGLSLIDGDDSSMAFTVLKLHGGTVDPKALLYYETDKHFLCFKYESDPSTSTNLHLLSAFRAAGFEPSHPSVQKILGFLRRTRLPDGMWIDKWHLSPYYPTSHAIIACAGYKEEMVEKAVSRVIKTQNADGSWGTNPPTAEETAYALQALCVWRKNGHEVNDAVLAAGAAWLEQHMAPPYPSLWIGKCLYSPVRVVEATVLSAIGMVSQALGDGQ